MSKMSKGPKRPIDAKDMPWSELGKDALDAAAETLWEHLRATNVVWDDIDHGPERPYHVQPSGRQYKVQQAVLIVIGQTVPALLRERAKDLRSDGVSPDEVYYMLEIADEIEDEHRKRA